MGIGIFIILLTLSVVQARKYCTTSYCGKSAINSPFFLEGQPPQECDSPGIKLSCSGKQNITVNIPYSGEFYVSDIFYGAKRIILEDPNNCLPRRLLSLNLSSSPLIAASYQNYTFLSCPRDQVGFTTYAIECLSNSTTQVLAMKYPTIGWYMCKEIITLPIPVSPFYASDSGYELPQSIDLTWNGSTAAVGGSRHIPVTGIFIMSFVLPIFVIYCICRCIHMVRQRNYQASESNQASGRAALSDIATYKTIVVGEGIITEPYDATCTICLTDYLPKDTVMFMPQCKHCFHVECITKWLTVNNNCPICRATQIHTSSC